MASEAFELRTPKLKLSVLINTTYNPILYQGKPFAMFTSFIYFTHSVPPRGPHLNQFSALPFKPILNQKNICLLHNGSTSSGQFKNRVYFFPNLKTAKIVQVVTLQIHTLNVWPRLTDHGSAEKRKSARVPTRSRSTTASFPRPSEAVALAAWAR